MDQATAGIVVTAVQAYGGIGLVSGVAFLVFGVASLDASARGAYAFRPLLLPGLVLLWPWVLWRWSRGGVVS